MLIQKKKEKNRKGKQASKEQQEAKHILSFYPQIFTWLHRTIGYFPFKDVLKESLLTLRVSSKAMMKFNNSLFQNV